MSVSFRWGSNNLKDKWIMDLFSDNVQFSDLATATRLFKESRAGFLQLFNNSPVCMSMTTTDLGKRVYVRVNKKFLEKFGFSESEVIGKTSIEAGILDEEESIRVGQIIKDNGRLHNDYVKCIAKDGKIVHTVSSIEHMEMNGKIHLVSFFIDVTQIIDQQKIIERQMQALELANRELEARNEEIEAQKIEIDAINNHLEELVQHRTQQLESRNNRIREYAFSNSHKVRGPLARILGLTSIINKENDLGVKENIVQLIAENAIELDTVIKEITQILAEEI